jgi:Ca2+-binding EF-hand superfamily protein
MLERMDANEDGAISLDEARGPMVDRFKMMDADKNGSLSREELQKHFERRSNLR